MAAAAVVDTPFGHSLPPEGPHTVTMHAPGWTTALRFRDGDLTIINQLKSIYPRFFPFGPAAQLTTEISKKIGLKKGHSIVAFLTPDVWASNREHAVSEWRKDRKLQEEDMKYHVVEIAGVRLYAVDFHMSKMMGAIFMWQHAGLIFSTRLAEHLLPQIESLVYLGEFQSELGVPTPTYLPEVESHELLRKRISGLLMRACVEEPKQPVKPDDVYLYQTGMAGIVRFHEIAVKVRPYPVAVFGAVFHSTFHYFEEEPVGMKHYGHCDDNDLNEFEMYLEGGGKCSYVFTEFPSNPVLVSVDLVRLRKLAEKHGFYIVVDETVASFCNVDVLPVADAIISSLTKSFSGYADVMAGSVALNPNASSYKDLQPLFAKSFRNELFAADASHLFKNSDDYLPRSVILNRNAAAMAAYLQTQAEDPKVPLTKVFYPPYAPSTTNLEPFLRKSTSDFPEPGYGCLFSVEFETAEQTKVFYDNLAFHQGPHLGAHMTLAMPYNAMVLGRSDPEYHASYGLSPNQIRFSAGLEDEESLVAVCHNAITALLEAGVQVKEGGDLASEMIAGASGVEAMVAGEEIKTGLDLMGGSGV
ncbi:cystathionine gamma-synthase [Apiospora rasikravindrae]|uniref:Cystathionine gamma-synthase n=1 Tax=Apiospora rasikravindrae TaxID=990691 RepID=A0ABR1UBA8_9PEZI